MTALHDGNGKRIATVSHSAGAKIISREGGGTGCNIPVDIFEAVERLGATEYADWKRIAAENFEEYEREKHLREGAEEHRDEAEAKVVKLEERLRRAEELSYPHTHDVGDREHVGSINQRVRGILGCEDGEPLVHRATRIMRKLEDQEKQALSMHLQLHAAVCNTEVGAVEIESAWSESWDDLLKDVRARSEYQADAECEACDARIDTGDLAEATRDRDNWRAVAKAVWRAWQGE